MWVLPFLYYHHAYPLTTFYQEWLAALLGVCALPLLLTKRYWQAPQVPGIVLLPVGLMLILLLQFMLGRIIHFDHVLMLSLYLLFAALLMMLGQHLREELGLQRLATVLAICLLVGAELNTLAGVLQHYRWDTFLNSVVTVKTSNAVYGNIAQPNHFANYIALGLLSLGLLQHRLGMRVWQTALLAIPILFVMVLSGSRSGWLYLIAVLILAWWWQRKEPWLRSLFRYAVVLCAAYALLHGLVQLTWLQGSTGSVTAAERLFGEARSGGIRLYLWQESMLIFAQFPLLGAGFGQFAYQHLQLAAELRNPEMVGLYNNAHNIVMQLAAETGLAGLLVFFVTISIWIWRTLVRGASYTLEQWWAIAILAVLGIHSLLEYPLWYLHFVGVAAVLLGALDAGAHRLELRGVGRLSVAAILLLGALSLFQGLQAYRHLESATNMRGLAARDARYAERARDELLETLKYPLFNSYAELFIAHMMAPNEDHLAEKLALNTRAIRYIPTAIVSYHQTYLLALSDQPQAALDMLEKTVWSYPGHYEAARAEIEALAAQHPAQFQPLLESAARNYEEYRRAAVPAR
ncbi:MAG: O-antigen ligase C-terminal domain-containing protein [Gammaproteobacteria bacterium]|nr:O-antigen ligase C-terminal domain-containing protein [Gammaproteobacteria bacterium]MBU1624760.1 O-antigen ligase C-terminal domain-containing protein [Gammaproteobacteria bacterium]MBU1982604.1 O-antigen ligase C-terminal domain-containing protein [Gammaproteobacteria bacterium]